MSDQIGDKIEFITKTDGSHLKIEVGAGKHAVATINEDGYAGIVISGLENGCTEGNPVSSKDVETFEPLVEIKSQNTKSIDAIVMTLLESKGKMFNESYSVTTWKSFSPTDKDNWPEVGVVVSTNLGLGSIEHFGEEMAWKIHGIGYLKFNEERKVKLWTGIPKIEV